MWKDFIAGGVSGVLMVGVGHPLDTMKVKMAVGSEFSSVGQLAKHIAQTQGWRGFYAGMESPLVGFTLINAWQFMHYGIGQSGIAGYYGLNRNDRLPIMAHPIVGGYVGAMTSLLECPMELVKIQMQASGGAYSSTLDCAKSIVGKHGIMAAYQGYLPTLGRNLIANPAYFGTYEVIRRQLVAEGEDTSAPIALFAGGFAGIMYWLTAYPFDAVKSVVQADAIDPSKRKYSGMTDCARQLYRSIGLSGFYRGLFPCLLRAYPANAASFLGYEGTLTLLGRDKS